MKTVQKFSEEYLELCRKMKPEQIARFLEDFRLLHAQESELPPKSPSKLISMKVKEPLLHVFKEKCRLEGVPYQTQIKKLMLEWINKS